MCAELFYAMLLGVGDNKDIIWTEFESLQFIHTLLCDNHRPSTTLWLKGSWCSSLNWTSTRTGSNISGCTAMIMGFFSQL